MGKRILKQRIIHYAFISMTGFLLIFLIDYLGFLVKFDTNLYDLFFRLRGSLKTDRRIVIAAIDEKTLEQFGRWPFSRNYYALLLDKMNMARAVGFDVIMTEPSADDPEFSKAIERQGNVILPIYLDNALDVVDSLRLFVPRKIGHLHAEPGIDGVVRGVFHSIYCGETMIPSFASALYEVFSDDTMERSSPSGKRVRTEPIRGVFQLDNILINYYGPPATFPYVSMADVINNRYPDSFFAGKIILVGFTAPGVMDRILTPFSYHRNSMPGIEVHANILNNLLDHSGIRVISMLFKYLSGFLLSLFLFIFFVRTNEKMSAVMWLGALVFISMCSFMLFTRVHLWIEPAFLYFAIIFIFATTYVYRLDEAARKLDARYSSIVSLPSMGGKMAFSEIQPTKGLLTFLSAEGINSRIQKLLSIEDEYEEKLQDVINEKTMKLSDALEMVKTMSNEVVLRLTTAAESKDELTGRHISRIGLYVQELASFLGLPDDLAEQMTFASAMHDVGKIGIPDSILLKPGKLTPDEFEIMKTHTIIGEKILSGSAHPMIQMAATIALCHHERWNGKGYPRGLKCKEIPLEARIVMICDIYEALRSSRPYKKSLVHHEAFMIITKGDSKISPGDFDPDVLQAFISVHKRFEEIFATYSDEPI
ncbi:MAG TPA: CHASE2 domain-containing protein [bacterium]|nr:CHASE2 domain-containing protein [bacterium]